MYIRVPLPPLPPHKKIKAQYMLQPEIWHIICFAAKLHIQSMQTQCKHINVFRTMHNMSTHKFECPAQNLTIHKGNYRESAQMYVIMQSYMNK